MTDRVCIYSNGTRHFHFSAEDLVSCCFYCGDGCHGGSPDMAWIYWQEDGLVSGGNYNSSQGCKPFSFPTCEHHEPGYTGNSTGGKKPCIDYEYVETPECLKACDDSYGVVYEDDKWYGQKVYEITGEEQIKAELFQNGPVEAVFYVYADFFNYKSGVYKYVEGDFVYGHAIKIIGWGVEDGVKNWLVANSWNTDWGDKGFFKILSGENYAGIESIIIAGEPLPTDKKMKI
ncbi:Cathepsin B [Operophtera brumata]|uniref:Cathepsin B n=1 Tax=Operophtera brumata TaxID=104452 RepID=A0A0L7L409_OPEBR|nr:Cathepsin B [Operophtera brumata]